MKTQIKQKFIEVYKLPLTIEEVDDNTHLFGPDSPYELDSMDVLLFINVLKEAFSLNYNQIDTDAFKTINNIVKFIESQKNQKC